MCKCKMCTDRNVQYTKTDCVYRKYTGMGEYCTRGGLSTWQCRGPPWAPRSLGPPKNANYIHSMYNRGILIIKVNILPRAPTSLNLP